MSCHLLTPLLLKLMCVKKYFIHPPISCVSPTPLVKTVTGFFVSIYLIKQVVTLHWPGDESTQHFGGWVKGLLPRINPNHSDYHSFNTPFGYSLLKSGQTHIGHILDMKSNLCPMCVQTPDWFKFYVNCQVKFMSLLNLFSLQFLCIFEVFSN